MANIKFMCTPGYPVSGGTVASMGNGAFLLKASLGIDAHTVKPVWRERLTAAVVITPVRVQTADHPSVPSALTRERRT